MAALLELLKTETVIGVITGSLITLIGIFISYYFQHKIRKENREKELKTQIFMDAIEQFVAFKSMIINLSTTPIEEIGKIPKYDIAIAKLSIVATNETLQKVAHLSAALLENFFHLLPERQIIDSANGKIKILSSQIDASFQKQNHLLNEMTAYNLRNDTDNQLWKKLQENFDFNSQDINKMTKENDEEYNKLNKSVKELTIKCLKAVNNLADLEIETLSRIRKELEMPFDAKEYQKTIKSNNKKIQEEMNNLFTKLT